MEDNISSPPADSVVQINQTNFNKVLASNEIVFILFYTEWCRFTSMMMPMFQDAAEEITKARFELGKVAIGKVDCDREETLATRFEISMYPTFKLFRIGLLAKNDYRGVPIVIRSGSGEIEGTLLIGTIDIGPRTVESFVGFIKEQLSDPIITFSHLNELHGLSADKGHIVAYLDSRDQQSEYDVLRRVATSLRDECQFHVGFVDSSQQLHPSTGELNIVFRTNRKTPVESDEPYHGPLKFDPLCSWVQEKCYTLVNEITHEYAQKLIADERAFVILLHMPSDIDSIKKFSEIVRQEMRSKKEPFKFFTADGTPFEHNMLHLMDKSITDLPLAVIVYDRVIYLLPDMEKPGGIKQYLQDVYSYKLRKQGVPLYKSRAVVNTQPDTNVEDEDDEDLSFGLFD